MTEQSNIKELKELKNTQQKEILNGLIARLANERSDLYYQSTSDIAATLYELIHSDDHGLNTIKKELVSDLSRRDIQVLI